MKTFPALFQKIEHAFGNIERAGSLRAFDLFEQIDHIADFMTPSYPPANIIQVNKDEWEIELAVAGFSREKLTVKKESDTVSIHGVMKSRSDVSDRAEGAEFPRYIKRGIAERQFDISFIVPDYTDVTDASFDNGMLTIKLKRAVPDTQKAKQIQVK